MPCFSERCCNCQFSPGVQEGLDEQGRARVLGEQAQRKDLLPWDRTSGTAPGTGSNGELFEEREVLGIVGCQ